MAVDRMNWGVPRTGKETLSDYWESLMELADHCEQEEFKFFLHCTSKTKMDSVQKNQRLFGGYTGLPARAPLASCEDMKGVWLAPSTADLPSRSPYGTHRIVMKVRDIMRFLGTPAEEEPEQEEEDRWDAASSEEEERPAKGKKGGGGKKAKDKNKKHRPVKRTQKDCYLKHKLPPKPTLEQPLLFFECAHHYGNTQYVRLLLVRPGDPWEQWCRETCLEVDIRHNPFLEFKWGRIFTYKSRGVGKDIVIEILVVGDILLDKLYEPPTFDKVGTISRAGFDPKLGVV